MTGKVGDTIVVESERADATGRRGLIEAVLQEQPPRYQVRWEDGHTSILAPSAGSASCVPASSTAESRQASRSSTIS
jgi:Domain of unknown function (DUF1918)